MKSYIVTWRLHNDFYRENPRTSYIYTRGHKTSLVRRDDVKNKAQAKRAVLKRYEDIKKYIIIDDVKVEFFGI